MRKGCDLWKDCLLVQSRSGCLWAMYAFNNQWMRKGYYLWKEFSLVQTEKRLFVCYVSS